MTLPVKTHQNDIFSSAWKCFRWNKGMSSGFSTWNKFASLIFKTLYVIVWNLIECSWPFFNRHNGRQNCMLTRSTCENNGTWTSNVEATTLALQKYQRFNRQDSIFLENMFIYSMYYICLFFKSWVYYHHQYSFFNTNSLFFFFFFVQSALGKLCFLDTFIMN